MASPVMTPHGRGYDTALSYFSHGNWGWTQAEWGTWCSSAKRENISFVLHLLIALTCVTHNTHTLTPYHSLIAHIHSLITMQLDYYEILNSRFALEHRYETDSDTIHNRSLAS